MLRGPAPIFTAALAVLRKKLRGDGDFAAILPGTVEGARPRLLLAPDGPQELAAALGEIRRWTGEGRKLREIGVVAMRRANRLLATARGRGSPCAGSATGAGRRHRRH